MEKKNFPYIFSAALVSLMLPNPANANSAENVINRKDSINAVDTINAPGKSFIINRPFRRYTHGYSYIIDPAERETFAKKDIEKKDRLEQAEAERQQQAAEKPHQKIKQEIVEKAPDSTMAEKLIEIREIARGNRPAKTKITDNKPAAGTAGNIINANSAADNEPEFDDEFTNTSSNPNIVEILDGNEVILPDGERAATGKPVYIPPRQPGRSFIIDNPPAAYEHGYSYIIDPAERAAFAAKAATENPAADEPKSSDIEIAAPETPVERVAANEDTAIVSDVEKSASDEAEIESAAEKPAAPAPTQPGKSFIINNPPKYEHGYSFIINPAERASFAEKESAKQETADNAADVEQAKIKESGAKFNSDTIVAKKPVAGGEKAVVMPTAATSFAPNVAPEAPTVIYRPTPEWAHASIERLASLVDYKLPENFTSLNRYHLADVLAQILYKIDNLNRAEWETLRLKNEKGLADVSVDLQLSEKRREYLYKKYTILDDKLKTRFKSEEVGSLSEKDNDLLRQLTRTAKLLSSNERHLAATRQQLDDYITRREYFDDKTVDDAQRQAFLSKYSLDEERLRDAFAYELYMNGYLAECAAEYKAEYPTKTINLVQPRFRVDGEVRLDTRQNIRQEDINTDRSRQRLRLRIYPDYNIDNNFHIKGMGESEVDLGHGNKNGHFDFDRLWLEGNIGKVFMMAGAFGLNLADGNIYDSRYKGLKLSGGYPVRYTAMYGENRHYKDFGGLDFDFFQSRDTLLGAGVYTVRERHDSKRHLIYMGKYKKELGKNLRGSLFLLYGDKDGPASQGYDKHFGFVAGIENGPRSLWRPGDFSWYAKYYYQPRSTYLTHTMNGMADYMRGFRGPGLGLSYVLAKDLMLNAELDDLKDLTTGGHNTTLWGAISWFFSLPKRGD